MKKIIFKIVILLIFIEDNKFVKQEKEKHLLKMGFLKVYEVQSNLLYSYIGHAITNGSEVTITNDQVYSYLDQILKPNKGQKEAVEQSGTIYEYKRKKLHLTKY